MGALELVILLDLPNVVIRTAEPTSDKEWKEDKMTSTYSSPFTLTTSFYSLAHPALWPSPTFRDRHSHSDGSAA